MLRIRIAGNSGAQLRRFDIIDYCKIIEPIHYYYLLQGNDLLNIPYFLLLPWWVQLHVLHNDTL